MCSHGNLYYNYIYNIYFNNQTIINDISNILLQTNSGGNLIIYIYININL